jgi:type VI secretion system secreted protein Hcp
MAGAAAGGRQGAMQICRDTMDLPHVAELQTLIGEGHMAIEYHLKLEGLQGESLASKHTNESELLSWSWGVSNPVSMTGSGMSAGKAVFADINLTKPTDKSSAKLLELCCTGKHIASGVISCSKSTGDKTPGDYMTIKMWEIAVTSYQGGGSHGEPTGTESVSLAFAKCEYDYKIQGKDGNLTAAGTVTFDTTKRELV